ncbi:Small ribosomal subunit biogenesis [Paecilomyces lecythidis]
MRRNAKRQPQDDNERTRVHASGEDDSEKTRGILRQKTAISDEYLSLSVLAADDSRRHSRADPWPQSKDSRSRAGARTTSNLRGAASRGELLARIARFENLFLRRST